MSTPAVPLTSTRAGILFVLVLISTIGPLSLNIAMPVLPTIQKAFAVSRESATSVLSLFLLGMAAAQLILGPLADRLGRRPVLLIGLALYVVASALAAFATSIEQLLAARILQALGATVGLPLARTIVRDLYDRNEAASMIGYITMVMVIAPMMSPYLGAVASERFGWQAIFVICVALGIAALIIVWALLPETRPASLDTTTSRDVIVRSLTLLKMPSFLAACGTGACASAIFFAFQGGAPYLVINVMGMTETSYALWFMTIALGYMIGNFISGRYSRRFGIERMILAGNMLGVAGALIAVALAFVPVMHPLALFLPMTLVSFSNGLVIPNAITAALSVEPKAAGAASGLAGALQFGLSALASYLVGAINAETALPLALSMTFIAIMGLVLHRLS